MKKTTLLLIISAWVLSSCNPAVSVRPLYSVEDVTSPKQDSRVEGDWISPDLQNVKAEDNPVALTWKVTRSVDGSYDVEVRTNSDQQPADQQPAEQTVTHYHVLLVPLNGELFFDAVSEKAPGGKHAISNDLDLGIVPAHVIGYLIIERDFLVVKFLASEWVRENTPGAFREDVSVSKWDDFAVITGTTPELRELVRQQANNPEAFGYVEYLCRPNTDCVASAYEHMLKLAPVEAHEEVLDDLSTHYLQVGNFERAVEMLQRLADLKPADFARRNSLATALLLKGDYERARREFSSALNQEPNNLKAQQGIGWSYFLDGNFIDAATRFRKCAESTERNSAEPVLLEYIALKRSGKSAEAEALLSKEIADFNGDPEDQLLLLLFGRRITSYPYTELDNTKGNRRVHLFAAELSLAEGDADAFDLWECLVHGSKDSLYSAAAKVELERLSSVMR